MNECGKLIKKNIYIPDLNDILESAKRQLGEGISFFEMADDKIKKSSIEVNSEKIYDDCRAIISCLAFACESFLKALYIYENNISENKIVDLWENLKKSTYKTDNFGNPIYLLNNSHGNKVFVFIKTDINGNKMFNESGNIIYEDKEGNRYHEGKQGKKIKQSGHELDRLIDLLSPNSRLYLEVRLLNIPMDETEKYTEINTDINNIKKRFIFSKVNELDENKYISWLEEHKKAFEEARYGGQIYKDFNIEFLYHLATQLKVLVENKIYPNLNQKENNFFSSDEWEKLFYINSKLNNILLYSDIILIYLKNNKEKINFMVNVIKNEKNYIELLNLSDYDIFYLLLKFNIEEINVMFSVINKLYDNNELTHLFGKKELIRMCIDIKVENEIILDENKILEIKSKLYCIKPEIDRKVRHK